MTDPKREVSNLGPSGIAGFDDEQLVQRIDQLVAEEHQLERTHAGDGLDDAGRGRLEALEVQLDQLWDLLRQRRARRHAGKDPDDAEIRSGDTVERYQQ